MIIKSSLGTGFQGVLLYIQKEGKDLLENEKPQIIVKNNVWGNPNVMARQMHNHSNKSSRLKSPVLHLSFAFAREDKITPEKEIEAVKSAMQHFGISEEKFQFVLARHNDTDNNHYHLALNRLDLNNKTLDTSWIKNDCVGIADRIEQEYDLHRVEGRTRIYDIEKNTYLTTFINKKREKNVQSTSVNLTEYKTKIQSAVREILADKSVTTKEELITKLKNKNIQAKVNIDENTKQIKGISYRYDNKLSVKGGDIGYNANVVSQKLEENKAIQQSTTIAPKVEPTPKPIKEATTKAPKTKAQKYANQLNQYFDNLELTKSNEVPGAKSAPGPTTKVEPKVEPKAIRPISDFDLILKSKGEEYGVIGYSKDFKYILLQTKEGKKLTPKNDKNYTFKLRSNKEFNGIEMDLLNRGKTFHIKEKTPYKIYKSETNESILFSNLTQDECLKAGLYNTDTFISQDIKNDFDDGSISDVDRKKKKSNQNPL